MLQLSGFFQPKLPVFGTRNVFGSCSDPGGALLPSMVVDSGNNLFVGFGLATLSAHGVAADNEAVFQLGEWLKCGAGYTKPNIEATSCMACAAGRYAPNALEGRWPCPVCPPNHYCPIAFASPQPCTPNSSSPAGSTHSLDCLCLPGFGFDDAQHCVACLPGQYKNTTSNHVCDSCPAHAWSPLASAALSQCACVAGYTGVNGTACTACTNSFKASYGPTNCTACPVNSVSAPAAISSSQCACLPGYTSAFNGSTCHPCAASSYKPTFGSDVCSPCPINSWSPAGSFAIDQCTCLPGFTGSNGTACSPCGQAQYKDSFGSAACSNCPAHASSPLASASVTACECMPGYHGFNGSVCTACAPNSLKSSFGPSTCTSCPLHAISPAASTSLLQCYCSPGYSGNNVGNGTACTPCGNTFYKPSVGPAFCSSCPANSWSPIASTSITQCVCQPGYTGLNGSACSPCPFGTQKPSYGPAVCVNCTAQDIVCFCPPGQFSNGTQCVQCSPGRYKSDFGPYACSPCPAHSNSTLFGSISVANCSCLAGYAGVAPSCVACAIGQFKTAASQLCVSCPHNSSTVAIASTSLPDCLCNAGFAGTVGGPCVACAPGNYSTGGASAHCQQCSAGRYGSTSSLASASCSAPCTSGHYCPTGTATPQSCPTQTLSALGSASISQCYCTLGFTAATNGTVCSPCEIQTRLRACALRALSCSCNIASRQFCGQSMHLFAWIRWQQRHCVYSLQTIAIQNQLWLCCVFQLFCVLLVSCSQHLSFCVCMHARLSRPQWLLVYPLCSKFVQIPLRSYELQRVSIAFGVCDWQRLLIAVRMFAWLHWRQRLCLQSLCPRFFQSCDWLSSLFTVSTALKHNHHGCKLNGRVRVQCWGCEFGWPLE